jgi:hypothetical protein
MGFICSIPSVIHFKKFEHVKTMYPLSDEVYKSPHSEGLALPFDGFLWKNRKDDLEEILDFASEACGGEKWETELFG